MEIKHYFCWKRQSTVSWQANVAVPKESARASPSIEFYFRQNKHSAKRESSFSLNNIYYTPVCIQQAVKTARYICLSLKQKANHLYSPNSTDRKLSLRIRRARGAAKSLRPEHMISLRLIYTEFFPWIYKTTVKTDIDLDVPLCSGLILFFILM